jgi:hypothetical protein
MEVNYQLEMLDRESYLHETLLLEIDGRDYGYYPLTPKCSKVLNGEI